VSTSSSSTVQLPRSTRRNSAASETPTMKMGPRTSSLSDSSQRVFPDSASALRIDRRGVARGVECVRVRDPQRSRDERGVVSDEEPSEKRVRVGEQRRCRVRVWDVVGASRLVSREDEVVNQPEAVRAVATSGFVAFDTSADVAGDRRILTWASPLTGRRRADRRAGGLRAPSRRQLTPHTGPASQGTATHRAGRDHPRRRRCS
jgi:hypothetical protein